MYPHTYIVCFEGGKKAQKVLPPAAGATPDPCHLSGPEMISNTFRHSTPSDTKHLGLPGGAAGAMDLTPRARTRTHSLSLLDVNSITLSSSPWQVLPVTNVVQSLPAGNSLLLMQQFCFYQSTCVCVCARACKSLLSLCVFLIYLSLSLSLSLSALSALSALSLSLSALSALSLSLCSLCLCKTWSVCCCHSRNSAGIRG